LIALVTYNGLRVDEALSRDVEHRVLRAAEADFETGAYDR
jgi:hypothetical protein